MDGSWRYSEWESNTLGKALNVRAKPGQRSPRSTAGVSGTRHVEQLSPFPAVVPARVQSSRCTPSVREHEGRELITILSLNSSKMLKIEHADSISHREGSADLLDLDGQKL